MGNILQMLMSLMAGGQGLQGGGGIATRMGQGGQQQGGLLQMIQQLMMSGMNGRMGTGQGNAPNPVPYTSQTGASQNSRTPTQPLQNVVPQPMSSTLSSLLSSSSGLRTQPVRAGNVGAV